MDQSWLPFHRRNRRDDCLKGQFAELLMLAKEIPYGVPLFLPDALHIQPTVLPAVHLSYKENVHLDWDGLGTLVMKVWLTFPFSPHVFIFIFLRRKATRLWLVGKSDRCPMFGI